MTHTTTTTSPAATAQLATRLAKSLRGGEVIELISDLGGGKTTFVQGLARGLGYPKPVTSPTFTLSQIYPLPEGRELHHYDLYRLGTAGIVGHELAEDIGSPAVITVIEWANVAESVLPPDRLQIEIEVTGESERAWIFKSHGPHSDRLIRALQS